MLRSITIGFILAIVSGTLAAPAPEEKKVDYQKLADETIWDWPEEKASLTYSYEHYKGKFEIEIQASSLEGGFRDSLVKFKNADGKEFFSITGHNGTVFVENKNILYYADFCPISTGCTLIAYDLQARKRVWKVKLKGAGPVDHSKYHNAVVLYLKEGGICVQGNESYGRYVEFVDIKTGNTVGHKKFKEKR